MTVPSPLITVVPLAQWTNLTEAPGVSEKNIINITQSGAATLNAPVEGTTFTSVYVNAPGAVTLTMPLASALAVGQQWLFKDLSGLASTNPIAVLGNGYAVDGGTSFTINIGYGDITLEWNGTAMSIVT